MNLRMFSLLDPWFTAARTRAAVTVTVPERGVLCYDGDCPWCRWLAGRLRHPLRRRGWRVAPLQGRWARQRLGDPGVPAQEMIALTIDGVRHGGFAAVLRLLYDWPSLRALARWGARPGPRRCGNAVYRFVAANRPCPRGICRVQR